MHRKVREALNNHEKENPHHREMNDQSMEDLKSLRQISPAKPLAMHVGYSLDGHNKNRDHLARNYDYRLLNDQKKLIDKEVFDLSEIASMLHDPEYITDDSHDMPTENQEVAKEILSHYLSQLGPEEAHDVLIKELYRPMANLLLERSEDDENVLNNILSEAMVQESPHSKEAYSNQLKKLLMHPVIDGFVKGNWKKKLPLIFKEMEGKKDA